MHLLPWSAEPIEHTRPFPCHVFPTLQHGTILIHGKDDHVTPLKADLLIVGNTIAEIGASISPPSSDTAVLDCTGKIISPGFVDTHHHVWQTQLKGRHANDLLLDYVPKGNLIPGIFTPQDVFWGELGGCLEAIDGGTTTVVDHAHMNCSPEHNSSAISATVASGIRSIFCYTPHARVASWSPLQLEAAYIPPWFESNITELAAKQPFGDGRVSLGFGFDGFFLPKEDVVQTFERVRSLGVKLITAHFVRNAFVGQSSLPALLDSYGLLKDDILLSHASNASPSDAAQLAAAHAHVSATPDTELQMAHGFPVCFRPDMFAISSLGVDCHSNNSGDILTQMRLALQSARAAYNQPFVDALKLPRKVLNTVEEAYNLGTIMGARAAKMGAEVGSIAVGKRADLVVFDGESPGMVCAAEHDPVAAIVMHASVRDVDTVIVDGKIRKSSGKLLPVAVEGKAMEWKDVAKQLVHSRERIQEESNKIDMVAATKRTVEIFYANPDDFVDHL